jgi:hypothetical protein
MRPQPPAIEDPPPSGGVMNAMRPQPPAVYDPPEGESPKWRIGREGRDPDQATRRWSPDEDIETGDDHEEEQPAEDQPDWERRAKDAERFSTTYLDSNYRGQWDDSLRAFNNQHPSDSKYNTENFRKRSRFYNPAPRTIIRKNEAAACMAFFSNQDLVSVQAMNPADAKQRLSADLNKQLLQWRLTNTIPWFHVLMGGIQDAQTMGACVAHIFWDYQAAPGPGGRMEVVKDRPWVDLKPLENFRFDPSANWMDPVNTSPYWIELVPMYVGDVREKMRYPDPKGRKWTEYDDADLLENENPDDSTRSARLGQAQDPNQEKRTISDYEVVWVRYHIHRWRGGDWAFWALGNGKLLTEPEPLRKTVFHGMRPYVMGLAHIETHKVVPSSVPTLVKPLEDKINAIENQRNDNVLFVLNKRYKVKRGTNVDTASLVRNVPAGITHVDNMEDLEEITWQDVTASSYQEADRARNSFDDLIGNFNPMAMAQMGAPRVSTDTVKMLNHSPSVLTDYMLTCFAITFAQPVLKQLILLEQYYETDSNILAIAGEKSKAYQKYGIDQVTDDMLDHQLTTTVNVGMGSTDHLAKLQRFMSVVQAFAVVAAKPPPGVNLAEVWKEMMALAGYQDGERFSTGQNPEMVRLEQVNKQLMMKVQELMRHRQDKRDSNVVKLVTSREANQTRERIASMQHGGKRELTYAQHLLDQDDMVLQRLLAKEGAEEQQQPQPQPSAPAAA